MKYIFLALALLIPHVCHAQNVLILNDTQVANMISDSCDAAVEGSMIGLGYAYSVYSLEDHDDKTLSEKIKASLAYAAIGGAVCTLLAIEGNYITDVLMNTIDNGNA